MSLIRAVYHPLDGVAHQPSFPATDQHPDAVRYLVGLYYVDAIGGQPTQAEIDALIKPAPTGNGVALDERTRTTAVQELQRLMSQGASQEEINQAILNLLTKES